MWKADLHRQDEDLAGFVSCAVCDISAFLSLYIILFICVHLCSSGEASDAEDEKCLLCDDGCAQCKRSKHFFLSIVWLIQPSPSTDLHKQNQALENKRQRQSRALHKIMN